MAYSILVPLDESTCCQAAANVARSIATAGVDVHLVALHVVNVTHIRGRLLPDLAGMLGFEPVIVPEQVERMYMEAGRQRLARFEAACAAANLKCETILHTGSVVDSIVRMGGHHDLILMGVRGETADRFPDQGGGTAERVIRRSNTSTLVVPPSQASITRIALGYDGSAGASRALRSARRLAELIGVPLDLLHVREDADDDAFKALAEPLAQFTVPVQTHLIHGEPQEALPAEAQRLGCDVLAMGYRGRSRVKDILLGRTTEWLIGNIDLGLLVAR